MTSLCCDILCCAACSTASLAVLDIARGHSQNSTAKFAGMTDFIRGLPSFIVCAMFWYRCLPGYLRNHGLDARLGLAQLRSTYAFQDVLLARVERRRLDGTAQK